MRGAPLGPGGRGVGEKTAPFRTDSGKQCSQEAMACFKISPC